MMKDPKTRFGAWFQGVKAREEEAARKQPEEEGGLSLSSLAFWRSGNGNGAGTNSSDTPNEEGTEVESQGLLPSFLTRNRQQEKDCLDCGLSRTQRFQAFVLCVIAGAGLMVLALFIFLPMVLLFPAKFALTFTIGSFLFMTGFSLLRGVRSQIKSLFRKDRVLFTLAYLGSMVLTLYAALVAKSYIMVMVAVIIQIAALLWYTVSYLPNGTAAMKVFTTIFCKTLKALCYPCRKMLMRAVSGGGN